MRRSTILKFLLIATILMLIKIYVANEIYYTSRAIQKSSQQINALKEERNILKLKIEKLKYKNTIVDPLFNYMPPKIESEDQNSSATIIEENKETTQIKKSDPKELFETIDIEEQF